VASCSIACAALLILTVAAGDAGDLLAGGVAEAAALESAAGSALAGTTLVGELNVTLFTVLTSVIPTSHRSIKRSSGGIGRTPSYLSSGERR
jgi:hypothetical protein